MAWSTTVRWIIASYHLFADHLLDFILVELVEIGLSTAEIKNELAPAHAHLTRRRFGHLPLHLSFLPEAAERRYAGAGAYQNDRQCSVLWHAEAGSSATGK